MGQTKPASLNQCNQSTDYNTKHEQACHVKQQEKPTIRSAARVSKPKQSNKGYRVLRRHRAVTGYGLQHEPNRRNKPCTSRGPSNWGAPLVGVKGKPKKQQLVSACPNFETTFRGWVSLFTGSRVETGCVIAICLMCLGHREDTSAWLNQKAPQVREMQKAPAEAPRQANQAQGSRQTRRKANSSLDCLS